jgi:hypothetical protein
MAILMSTLILKRGDPSRRRDDDYAVLENGAVVGRIFKVPVAPQDRPWMWASGHNGDIKRAAHGYEPTRQAVMAAFAKVLATRVTGSGNRTVILLLQMCLTGGNPVSVRGVINLCSSTRSSCRGSHDRRLVVALGVANPVVRGTANWHGFKPAQEW